MTAAALLGVAGSGRSAPSAAHPQPYRYRGGMSAKPAADLPPNVCNFRLSEVRNFRLSLTSSRMSPQPAGQVARVRGSSISMGGF